MLICRGPIEVSGSALFVNCFFARIIPSFWLRHARSLSMTNLQSWSAHQRAEYNVCN